MPWQQFRAEKNNQVGSYFCDLRADWALVWPLIFIYPAACHTRSLMIIATDIQPHR